MTPRGLRNNNPCNIRICKTIYEGEIIPSKDKAFKQFRTMAYGYRAAFVLLHYYYYKLKLKTIRKMLNRWAPPTENNTDAYIQNVSTDTDYYPDREIDITDGDLMVRIVAAMSKVENGQAAVLADVIAGWNLYNADIG